MIKRLYVNGFRCLENFTLNFDDRSSALLIGKNGAGKSTVRRSLMIFQNICRSSNRVGSLLFPSDFAQSRTDRPIRFQIEVDLRNKHFVYTIAFEWPANFREARILDEELVVDGVSIFSRQHSQISLLGTPAFRLDWHIFALPVINEREGEQSIAELKAFFAGMILISPVPGQMTGYSEEASSDLLEDAANFASCLRNLLGQKPAAYSKFESYLKDVIPDFSSIETIERGERGNQLIVRFEQENPPATLDVEFKNLSSGEKCYFLSAYIVASHAVKLPIFCFWDEPDNHLSLSEVQQFIISLRKINRHGAQFVATSHHPETIRSFADENTFVLTRASHLEPTVIRPLSELPYQGDLIHALMRDEVID